MSQIGDTLTGYSEKEKVAYLSIVASMAAADGELADEELEQIRQMCFKLSLTAIGVEAVLAAAEFPERIPLERYLENLRGSDLKFALLADVLFMVYADGKVTSQEKDEYERIATSLSVTEQQLLTVIRYVDALTSFRRQGKSKEELLSVHGHLVGEMASCGVNVGSVAVAGIKGDALDSSEFITQGLQLGFKSMNSFHWLFRKTTGR
jgi:uncharacterized tellurite resistance protein B-like protein